MWCLQAQDQPPQASSTYLLAAEQGSICLVGQHLDVFLVEKPSGKQPRNYEKPQFRMGKSTISTGQLSIANCQFTRGYQILEIHVHPNFLLQKFDPLPPLYHGTRAWSSPQPRESVLSYITFFPLRKLFTLLFVYLFYILSSIFNILQSIYIYSLYSRFYIIYVL